MPKGTRALILGLLAADALVLLATQALVRFAGCRLLAEPPAILETDGGHLLVAAVLTAYLQGVFALNNLYRPGHLLGGYREYAGVVKAATYAFVALGLASLLAGVGLQREGLVLSWALAVLAVGPARFALRRIAFRLRRRGLLVQRLIVVGADEHALALARELNSPEGHGLQVVGFLDDFRPVGARVLDGLRVLGDPRSAAEVCRQHDVRRMVLVPHAVSWESLRDLLEMAAARSEFRVEMAPGLHHLLAHSPRPAYDGVAPLITLEPLCIRGLNAILKRLLDLCLAVALLPFLGALLALCWLASRLDGGGPVLVRRRALGRAGSVFPLLALAASSAFMLEEGPPPVEEPAGWLVQRAWRLRHAVGSGRLGKLPNVLNVLAGRMSLVGPRVVEAERAAGYQPWLLALSLVRPGLTGPAAGSAAEVEEQALLDVAYIRHYSLWLDLRLLFASLKRVLCRETCLRVSYPAEEGEAVLARLV
jgi:lipopolysaccharide/colanic/teichoic acid biosynthesis glycosyltransferase